MRRLVQSLAAQSPPHHEQSLTVMMVRTRNLIAYGTRHLEMTDGTVREDTEHAESNGAV
jgi:hypothetical protein